MGAKFVNPKQLKALYLASTVVLLIGAFICAGPALAQQIDPCENGKLGPGNADNPQDLKIDHECHVGNGTYNYRDVNIVAGTRTVGKLIFDELIPKVKIDFWARSILVENMGSLLAPNTGAAPFGSMGGVLTIHLYGADQGVNGTGIICRSPKTLPDGEPSRAGQCGIPNKPWDSNGVGKFSLPGGVSDNFYKYSALPLDNGEVGEQTGFFGYKVLAVSYGGTLNLRGKKGATYASLLPKATGTS
jgi:hypothetical protein